METGLGLAARIRQEFGLEKQSLETYSPLVLAYIGDGIYELVLRTLMVDRGNRQVNKLHRMTSQYAKAQAQSKMVDFLKPHLTPEEADIYRRGRNAKSYTTAKNASVVDYRRATGFEALMGYLYLSDQFDRLLDLIRLATDQYQPEESQGAEARNRRKHGAGKRKD